MHYPQLKSCLVIPCYNEALRLPVEKFLNFLLNNDEYDLVFVNDGSTDKTSYILNKMKMQIPDRIDILSNIKNSGKGEAVRVGMTAAASKKLYQTIGYLDADLSIPLIEYMRLNTYFSNEIVIFVFGSRVQRLGAKIKKTFFRHIISRIFATLASSLLQQPVYDTQCGIKVFRASVVLNLFSNKFISKWLFDIEIFFRIFAEISKKDVNDVVLEIPLNTCEHIVGSKIQFYHYLQVPFYMWKINRYYKKLSKTN